MSIFPFTAVVGQDELKLALTLAAIDPAIGGVLARGEKGSGKTTLARGFASLRGDMAPFVELPLGATEDRVLGSIDLAATLAGTGSPDGAGEVLRPGLLAGADGGVVYVDEINLLADHLVDSLLDVAASGVLRVERDGIAATQPTRFVLLGTMNPEEGELRPQLLDRFGLCVDVAAVPTIDERVDIVARRLAFEQGELVDDDDAYRSRLAAARPAALDRQVLRFASALALAVGAEGLRADLVLCRAAAALAGWEGRAITTTDDVERVAGLVLAHRRRRHPFDPPSFDDDDLDDAVDHAHQLLAEHQAAEQGASDSAGGQTSGADDQPGADAADESGSDDTAERRDPSGERGSVDSSADSPPGDGDDARTPVALGAERTVSTAMSGGMSAAATATRSAGDGAGRRRTPVTSPRGRFVRDVALDHPQASGVAVAATVRNVAARRALGTLASTDGDEQAGPESHQRLDGGDVRAAVRQEPVGALVVVALDTSGSMGASDRVEAATGVVLGVLADAYQRRDRVALVAFGGSGARTVLAPTGSIEIARRRLAEVETGGATPLAAGLRHSATVIAKARRGDPDRRVILAIVTDGRATGADPEAVWVEVIAAATELAAVGGIDTVVVDAETGSPRLGLAAELADALGARCLPIAEIGAAVVRSPQR